MTQKYCIASQRNIKCLLDFLFSFGIFCRIYRRKYLGVMVAGTWLGAFCSLIPTWQGKWGQFGMDRNIGSCSILPDKDSEYNRSMNFLLFIECFLRLSSSDCIAFNRE